MKKVESGLDTKEKEKIDKDYERIQIKVGAFYGLLKHHQKRRFDRIEGSILRKYGLHMLKNPLETILIRQIALNTIRIDEYEAQERTEKTERILRSLEDSRRRAADALHIIVRREKGQLETGAVDDVRNLLRDSEGLPKTKTRLKKSGHERRFYDKVERTNG